MTIDIRSCSDTDDLRASMASIWHYFGLPPTDEAVGNFADSCQLQQQPRRTEP